MVLILLSWLYILFTSINLGISFEKTFRIPQNDFIVTAVLGLFTSTILGSIGAIVGRINIEFHLLLLALNGILFYLNKNRIVEVYSFFIKKIQQLSLFLKLFLGISSLLILAQCAALPYVVDNESYYIQTIKWLNEYGFVKGLANLHIFLGQTSGWHITQSVFNFSFLYKNLNDLSGFCLLLGNLFAVIKLNEYFDNQKKIYLIIGLLPLANALLFQFISAPSPDIPVYIFSFIVFFYFIENYKNPTPTDFTIIVVLSLFILYCKPTALGIVLIPLMILIQNFKVLKNQIVLNGTIGILVFGLFVTKNSIITGYPLYPTQLCSWFSFDFKVPKELTSFYFDETKLYGFFLTKEEFHSISYFQLFIKWISFNKINALFNCTNCLLVVISPFILNKYYKSKSLWILYGIMVAQFIVLLSTSPQFRFFIHFTLFFSILSVVCFFYKKNQIYMLLCISGCISAVLVFFPLKLNALTTNKLIENNSYFKINQIVLPSENSKTDTIYSLKKIYNLQYYSPNDAYFWISGNGKLPCVNERQVDYFKTYFQYIPQQRSSNIKDGFYSKKIAPNE